MSFCHPAVLLRSRSLCLALASCAVLWAASPASAQKVPEGFRAELIYQSPEIEHPSVVTCDDDGNLYVGEDPMDMRGPTTKEFDRVILIRWDKQTGQPIRTVFCDNLAAVFGLIWHEGALYVMHAPHYSVFRDTNGDGVADERKDLAEGFGPPAGIMGFNDHIVTGTRLGLDGRVYVSVGDKGIPKATGSDGSTITLEGGGVVSMRLDGSQLEVVTSGTRNHLDVAMDSLDNIFTYDNTDDGLGWWTRFTHHVPTGYYGYPYDYLTHGERHLPRISEHGGGSPVGAACYREAAWPAKYRDNAFHCEWGKGKIQRFVTKRSGATFTAEIEDFMDREGSEEFRPQDLCFSPDGKTMYVADWNYAGWCNPKVAGRLFRVTYVGSDVPAEPARVADDAPIAQQVAALGHPAHSERMQAQWALARLGQPAVAPVEAVIGSSAGKSAKVHALWTLSALADRVPLYDPAPQWIKALGDGDADVRSQAARALGERRVKAAAAPLAKALADSDPNVRMWAAIGLGRIGDASTAPALYTALNEKDPFARFAMVQALRALGAWQPAQQALDSPDADRRGAVLLALTGVYDPAAVETLAWGAANAKDAALRPQAIESLAYVVRQADPYKEGWWGTQPARGKPARPKKNDWSATPTILGALRQAIAGSNEAVRKQAAKQLVELQDTASLPTFVALARDAKNSPELRADTLAVLVALKAPQAADVIAEVLNDAGSPPAVVLAALDSAGQIKTDSAVAAVERLLKSGDPQLRAKAVAAFGLLRGQTAAAAVAQALADPELVVRQSAVRTAGEQGLRDTVPTIVPLVSDGALRDDARRALAQMPDRRALSVYLDGLVDQNPGVRDAARGAISAVKASIGQDIIERYKNNELPGPVRVELQPIMNSPTPLVTWQVVGPWPNDHLPQFDPAKVPDLSQPVDVAGKPVSWRKIGTNDPQGRVTLNGQLNPDSEVWALAYCTIESSADSNSFFKIGSDDEVVMWINGAKVHEFHGNRGWAADQGSGQLPLKKGTNHVLLLVGNHGGPWEYSLSLGARRDELAFLYENVPVKLDTNAYREFAAKTPGDAAKGREIFADLKGVGCIKCHAVAGQGAKTGPDLAAVGTKYPREELIRSVLEPSNRVAAGYQVTTVITDDGKVYTGIIKSDTQDAVELIDAEGRVSKIATAQIDERHTSSLSLMPNGLKDGLSLENFADVIAYLESLK